jgi:hypothetical protein
MPSGVDQVYLMNPVRLDGADVEGGSASTAVDGTRTIPVVIIGGAPPQAGQLLVALSVGGRWVAESGGASTSLACSPCAIPTHDLTLSWTNVLIGSGSTPLVYSPPGQWNSPCTNQMLFSLSCPGSNSAFSVTYFLSGSCPTGQGQSCTSPGSGPLALLLDSATCSPFYLHYTVTAASCPVLYTSGYTSLVITE